MDLKDIKPDIEREIEEISHGLICIWNTEKRGRSKGIKQQRCRMSKPRALM
jgi:hypothetical protein